MKKLLTAALFLLGLWAGPATAQCTGIFEAGQVCGSALGGLPQPINGGNVTHAVTTDYDIQTSDCGNTIEAGMGSTGYFTLTLPSVSGFPTTCVVAIHNSDTTRGKRLSGFPSDFNGATQVLWPDQFGTVQIIGGVWQSGVNPGIYQPSVGVTLNVDHASGSDALGNDCLAISGSGACATIYHAYQLFATVIKPGPLVVATIQSDCGFTETPPEEFIGSNGGGNGSGIIFILGIPASPTTCSWSTAGIGVSDGANVHIEGFKTINAGSSQTWITVTKQSVLITKNMEWGSAASGTHIQIFDGGVFVVDGGGTEQVGDAGCAPGCFFFHVINNGGTLEEVAQTVSVPSALTFNTWYTGQNSGSSWVTSSSLVFTGAGAGAGSTGAPYLIARNATLRLQGAVLPGNGSTALSFNGCNDNGCVPGFIGTFSGAPTCDVDGQQAVIVDSTTNVLGATVTTGSGPYEVVAFCKSTVYRVAAVSAPLGLPSGSAVNGIIFSALPTPAAGMMAYITDGKSSNCGDSACTTFGTTITAGAGALKLLAWYNGSNWTLIGK